MLRRNTNQRQIVYDSINELGHASSEQLIKYINANYCDISLATIYRNISILIEDDLVRKVKFNNIDVYETVKMKHNHFICTHCGKIIDITPSEIDYNLEGIKDINSNRVESCEVVFYGTCSECLKKITN